MQVHSLRRRIGIVAQETVLFTKTIKENVMYGLQSGINDDAQDEPSDEEIWAACEKANAAEFIREFPQGLQTNVGERGVKLSGGQKQASSQSVIAFGIRTGLHVRHVV